MNLHSLLNGLPTRVRIGPRVALACVALEALSSARAQVAPPTSSPTQFAAAAADPITLSIFEVTGERDEGYRSTQTLSGSRTLTNLRNTPNSISVINRELIDDLNATTVFELTAFSITGEIDTNPESTTGQAYIFRGIRSGFALRDGVTWFVPTDTYAIERVEVLRGPTAFLYGEGGAGGLLNQLTKKPAWQNFQRANLIAGSDDLYRVELDVNRRLSDLMAVRLATAYHQGGGSQNHEDRVFKAGLLTFSYRPFRNTLINISGEYGRNHRVMGSNMLADAYSTTGRTGATVAYTATTGGLTFVPATGLIFNTATPASRRSSGTNIVVSDTGILPTEYNFPGPDAYNRNNYHSYTFSLEQRLFENLHLQASGALQAIRRNVRTKAGSSQAGIYLDGNPTLPGGAPNPKHNQYYTEFFHRVFVNEGPQHNARITAVYDWKLPFMAQRIVGNAVYHDTEPTGVNYSEFVVPGSTSFAGTLVNANTLAAYQANNTTLSRNYFYRRFYLKDGDSAELTKGGIVPGRSVLLRDTVADGASGRLTDRLYRAPGYGAGLSGSYFKERLHTLVGWRRDAFNQDPGRDFYNAVTRETYRLDSTAPVHTRINKDSINYGGVFHPFKFASVYYNYAESVSLSGGIGADGLIPGTVRGPATGDGHEYGLRWSLLDGRIESNWTYYITNSLNNAASPAVPAAVRQVELGTIFTDLNPEGGDTQATKATGFEFETVANITPSWRLTWNFSTNELETSERYPALHNFQARAREQRIPTPETDAFLATSPDGTPLPGFTRVRSNLVTNYRFGRGRLKGFSIGASVQYRDESYLGNFDLNRDGTAEEIWTSGYTIYNLMLGYRMKILERPASLSLNINNIFDQEYFRALSLSAGDWGEGRSFRLAARFEL